MPGSLLRLESWSPPGAKEHWEPPCLGPTNATNLPETEECYEPSLEAEGCCGPSGDRRMLRTLPDPKNATNPPGAEECYELFWGRGVLRTLPEPKNATNPHGAEECYEPSRTRRILQTLLGRKMRQTPVRTKSAANPRRTGKLEPSWGRGAPGTPLGPSNATNPPGAEECDELS
jgi:hypothetical protein